MVSFERESRWIRVNGILPESLRESDSRPTSDPDTANFDRLKWQKLAGFFHTKILTSLFSYTNVHAHTVETGWCSHNVITAQVKTESIIQIDFKFQGTNFGGYIASELSFMGSIAYFDKHSVWIKVCKIGYTTDQTPQTTRKVSMNFLNENMI